MAKKASATELFLQYEKEIRTGKFAPIYVLYGEETYFIDKVTQILEQNVVPEESKSFNQHIHYGKELSCNDLIAMCKRYPMMSDFQLIVVKDAQDIKDMEALTSYFENPLTSTVLVLAMRKGKLDMRSRLAKAASKHKITEFAPLRDYQMRDWLPVFAESKGKRIDIDAINRLIDLIGADLTKIHNELDKIFATVSEGGVVVGGYNNSSLTSFPAGDYNGTDAFIGASGSAFDAFGISLLATFTCMDPVGSTQTTDLGVLT
jgi:DNA polymerase-3 subunit delta